MIKRVLVDEFDRTSKRFHFDRRLAALFCEITGADQAYFTTKEQAEAYLVH